MINATHLSRRFVIPLLLVVFSGGVFLVSCGKPPATPKSQTTATTKAAAPAPIEAAGPGPGEKTCFACKGEGTVKCLVPGCVDGQVDCPGPCLKLSQGVWRHMEVAGHDPNDLWITFTAANGGTMSWNQNHVGDVIEIQNGSPVNVGKCKICGGTGKVKCEVCKGTGQVACPVCNGKKFVPIAWTATDNPYFNRQPDIIRLTDGRVLLGRVAATVGDDLTIVTRDKKILHVKSSDILPKTGTNAPAARTLPPT